MRYQIAIIMGRTLVPKIRIWVLFTDRLRLSPGHSHRKGLGLEASDILMRSLARWLAKVSVMTIWSHQATRTWQSFNKNQPRQTECINWSPAQKVLEINGKLCKKNDCHRVTWHPSMAERNNITRARALTTISPIRKQHKLVEKTHMLLAVPESSLLWKLGVIRKILRGWMASGVARIKHMEVWGVQSISWGDQSDQGTGKSLWSSPKK